MTVPSSIVDELETKVSKASQGVDWAIMFADRVDAAFNSGNTFAAGAEFNQLSKHLNAASIQLDGAKKLLKKQ